MKVCLEDTNQTYLNVSKFGYLPILGAIVSIFLM